MFRLLVFLLIATSANAQMQDSAASLDFNQAGDAARRGHLIEAESLFQAALQRYFKPGQKASEDASIGAFYQGMVLLSTFHKSHDYAGAERVIESSLSAMEGAAQGATDKSNFSLLYLGLLADCYRAEADYTNAALTYEIVMPLRNKFLATNKTRSCNHFEDFIGMTEVFLVRGKPAEVEVWLTPAWDAFLSQCPMNTRTDTRLVSSKAILYSETARSEQIKSLEHQVPDSLLSVTAIDQTLLLARIRAGQKHFAASDSLYESALAAIPASQLFQALAVLKEYAQTARNYGRSEKVATIEERLQKVESTLKQPKSIR